MQYRGIYLDCKFISKRILYMFDETSNEREVTRSLVLNIVCNAQSIY